MDLLCPDCSRFLGENKTDATHGTIRVWCKKCRKWKRFAIVAVEKPQTQDEPRVVKDGSKK
jgi:RNase P subunit RPR2